MIDYHSRNFARPQTLSTLNHKMSLLCKCPHVYKLGLIGSCFKISMVMTIIMSRDAHKNPSYWAHVCFHNMARSAKEVTTLRRVLEPLFHKFDSDKLWLPEKGLAFAVLKYLQMMLEESGYYGNFVSFFSHNG